VSSDYVLLATQTVSGTATAISFDGYFSSTYDAYKCVFYNLDLTANSQKAQKEANKTSAQAKLSALGLTTEEIKALIG
jgi:hypothetical protein